MTSHSWTTPPRFIPSNRPKGRRRWRAVARAVLAAPPTGSGPSGATGAAGGGGGLAKTGFTLFALLAVAEALMAGGCLLVGPADRRGRAANSNSSKPRSDSL